MDAKTVSSWGEQWQALLEQLGPHFARRDLRQQAYNYLRGLLAQLERKNGWQLAEQAGDATPDGVQRLLGPAR